MRLRHLLVLIIVICLAALGTSATGQGEDSPTPLSAVRSTEAPVALTDTDPGDRIQLALPHLTTEATAVRVGQDYRLDAGDKLSIYVTGRSKLDYKANPAGEEPRADSNSVTVALTGEITIPLAGTLNASGRTPEELRVEIEDALSKYIREPLVAVVVSSPRTMRVWVNGAVKNPGPQYVTATTTIVEALLRAGIEPRGSTRLITLKRDDKERIIDLYRIAALGDLGQNVLLEADDSIVVPPVKRWADVRGEAVRPGKYEMVSLDGKTEDIRVSDLLRLAMGMTPAAASAHASLIRSTASGDWSSTSIDAKLAIDSQDPAINPPIEAGDILSLPSMSAYQPMVRMVGEFRGDGVYQRVVGSGGEVVRNKSGIYPLARGQTAGEIIRETGGVTPQADLRRARVERVVDGKTQVLNLNLDTVLMRNDSSSDVVLENGDTLVLPGLNDLVSVFGEVSRPGAYSYVPNRRLVDYLADAGGPTNRAKQRSVTLVRGDPANPTIVKVDALKAATEGGEHNPFLEPGDIIYVPERIIADWRDIAQIISAIRLITLF